MSRNKKLSCLQIFADGGSRGNPGPAAVGVVLKDITGNIVEEIAKPIGASTNNIAEYLATIYGLQEAIYLGAQEIILNVDSQLVARQLRGEYRVKNPEIRKFFDLALNLFRGFGKVEIKEIPREQNKEADALVNKALNNEVLL